MGKHKKKSKSHKEKKSKHKHRKKYSSSDSSSTSEDEWVEKVDNSPKFSNIEQTKHEEGKDRDDWMHITSIPGLYSNKDKKKQNKEKKQEEKEADKYNPKTSVRELNPYWKDGGDGLPSSTNISKFKKPTDDINYSRYQSKGRTSNWRKKSPERDDGYKHTVKEIQTSCKTSDIIFESEENIVTDNTKSNNKEKSGILSAKEMNELAAKIVKAEILGNVEKVTELKEKLEKARSLPTNQPEDENEEVLLTLTTSKGISKPVTAPNSNLYDNKRKQKTINTHDLGKRQKYYPDDGKYSLQNMFEIEKYSSSSKQEEEFMNAATKLSKSDDIEDMFMDNIQKKESDEKTARKERDRAIREQQKVSQSLDNCQYCIQSSTIIKHLMVSIGETVFLNLPPYEPLTEGHCFISPVRHVTCSTQLDENEWSEILDFRKSLTNMFRNRNKTAIFYETAVNLHQYPHMVIHCVPVPEEQGDLAPIYFKKAIDDCEMEWSTNKKLINMAGKDVRRSVPKGLPYFWVSFGMKEGFAHVIEEQRYFPKYFAEEIIGGILDLHHSKWRRANAQKFDLQKSRVMDFSKDWTKHDCTKK